MPNRSIHFGTSTFQSAWREDAPIARSMRISTMAPAAARLTSC
jgi:hypothetical protein